MQKKTIFIGLAIVLVLVMALGFAAAATRAAGTYAKGRFGTMGHCPMGVR